MDEIQTFFAGRAYVVYAAVMILGALMHWMQKAKKGEATWDMWDYWIAETPGYSAGTAGALVAAIWFVFTNESLDGMKWQMLISSAWAFGFAIDSAISPSAKTTERKIDANKT